MPRLLPALVVPLRATLVVPLLVAFACGPDEPAPEPDEVRPSARGVCVSLPPDNGWCPVEGDAPTLHWKLGILGADGQCRANIPVCEDGRGFGFVAGCSGCRECEAQAEGRFVAHLPNGTTVETCGD